MSVRAACLIVLPLLAACSCSDEHGPRDASASGDAFYMPTCEADCECFGRDPVYGNDYNACIDGRCVATGRDMRWGTCDPGNRGPYGLDDFCACGGGTCEITPGGGCCRAPDGHVAQTSSDPVCAPADAGPRDAA